MNGSGSLIEALALGPREHVALVGGGGKTTLLIALTRELAANREGVLASTTTKVRRSEAAQVESFRLIDEEGSWRERLCQDLDDRRAVFLGRRILDSEKVQGVDPALLDDLFMEGHATYIIVEADGAAGHPLKAPDSHEPVIPGSVTSVVSVIGLEALGLPMTTDVVFRADLFEKVTGARPGDTITGRCISRLISHPEGLFKGTPPSSRKIVFLNKEDLVRDREGLEELAHLILSDGDLKVERVVVGSLTKKSWEIHERVRQAAD
ncbi:MAG: putative selenium-dependent hydroxylase accessory protein YqeC [Desulfobacteraceae bacterium]|nr:MAG: putative selenium-dependent hydroxylase accessory protein YqeC [Desulfobacteraceae bacterium]